MKGYRNVKCSLEGAILTSDSRKDQMKIAPEMEDIRFSHTESSLHDTTLSVNSQNPLAMGTNLAMEATRSATKTNQSFCACH